MTSKGTMLAPLRCQEVETFVYDDGAQEQRIRSFMWRGERFYVAVDVVTALGLDPTIGSGAYLGRLTIHEKRLVQRRDCPELFVGTRAASYQMISGSGLAKVLKRVESDRAGLFKGWLEDVLPPHAEHSPEATPAEIGGDGERAFQFSDDVAVRVVVLDGSPWFVAVDVARALGLGVDKGAAKYLKALREDERRTLWKGADQQAFGGPGSAPRYVVISESGLYKLVMRSDRPEAKRFQDWVTRDVLPAIRKDGAYIKGEERVASGELGEAQFILQAFEMLKGKVDRLSTENARLERDNETMSAELNRLTVSEFVALRHEYMGRQRRVTLGVRAAEICRVRGIPLEKQDRLLHSRAGDRTVVVNVYDRTILEEAYRAVFG